MASAGLTCPAVWPAANSTRSGSFTGQDMKRERNLTPGEQREEQEHRRIRGQANRELRLHGDTSKIRTEGMPGNAVAVSLESYTSRTPGIASSGTGDDRGSSPTMRWSPGPRRATSACASASVAKRRR